MISVVDRRCVRIVDIKCPTSNESKSSDLKNLKKLDRKDQVKFVIGNRKDYEYAKEIARLKLSFFPTSHILFSPLSEKMIPARLAEWILEDNFEARLHLQLHKIIWPDTQRVV